MINLKRIATIGIIGLILGLLLAGCGGTETSKKNNSTSPTVRMAVDTATGGGVQFRVAKAKGFFEKNGVNVELINFPNGIDTINAILVQQADTGLGADFAVINSLGKGDFKVVSVLTRTNEKSAERTILFSQDTIHSAADLRGKKLGVAKGSVYEFVWAKYLEINNIPENEVTYVPYSSPDEALVALQKGDIDAVWIGGALIDRFAKIKNVHALTTIANSGTNVISYFVVDRKWAEANPKLVEGLLKGLKESTDYLPGHEKEVADIIYKEIKLPKDSMLKELDYMNYAIGLTQEDVTHLAEIKSWSEQKGRLNNQFVLQDKVDGQYLQRALPDLVTYRP